MTSPGKDKLFAGLAVACLMVSSCSSPAPTATFAPTQSLLEGCMYSVNPPGAYQAPKGVAAPHVIPADGGTQAGADAVNACIQSKAKTRDNTNDFASAYEATTAGNYPNSSKKSKRTTSGFCPKHAAVLYGGTTYCIETK